MRPGEQLLVRLDVQEEDQIIHVGAEGVDLVGLGADEGVGVGVEDGGEGVEDEPGVIGRDLERLGEGGGGDAAGRGLPRGLPQELLLEGEEGLDRVGEDELGDREEAVLEGLAPGVEEGARVRGGRRRIARRRRRRRRRVGGAVGHGGPVRFGEVRELAREGGGERDGDRELLQILGK